MAASVEERLDLIESREEIEAVMAEYLYLADRDPDAGKIAALFTAEAIWEPRGNFALEQAPTHGQAAIRELFAGLGGTMSFGAHFITNSVIEIEPGATRAHGRWHTLELLTKENPTVEIFQVAWYENDFERVDRRWRISHIRFEDTLSFPFTEGWSKTRFVSLVSGECFPHPGLAAD